MSKLEQNTTNLELLLEKINNLPEAAEEVETVELATPTISVTAAGVVTATVTQETGGKVESGSSKTASRQLPVQTAQTITPGTTNKTIASGKYLVGTQTIKGDTNLVAGNIKSGVSIFGITGTYSGSGSGPSVIASVTVQPAGSYPLQTTYYDSTGAVQKTGFVTGSQKISLSLGGLIKVEVPSAFTVSSLMANGVAIVYSDSSQIIYAVTSSTATIIVNIS